MKPFVDWLLAQRVRLVILSVVTAPLLQVVAAALLALETARRGVTQGAVSGAATIVGLVLLAAASRTDLRLLASVGVVCAVTGVGIGALIRRAGSLAFAFQAVLLVSLAAVALLTLFVGDTRALFGTTIAELVELLRAGGASPEQVAFIEERGAMLLLAAAVFTQLIGALLLAYWWALLAAGQRSFGAEFRRLRLGRVLGGLGTGLIALSLVFDTELVQNLSPLAMLGFLLQGLAVLHAWAHAKRWPPWLMVPLYVLLAMPPFTVLLLLPLSVVGVVDNWFDLRAALRPQS